MYTKSSGLGSHQDFDSDIYKTKKTKEKYDFLGLNDVILFPLLFELSLIGIIRRRYLQRWENAILPQSTDCTNICKKT